MRSTSLAFYALTFLDLVVFLTMLLIDGLDYPNYFNLKNFNLKTSVLELQILCATRSFLLILLYAIAQFIGLSTRKVFGRTCSLSRFLLKSGLVALTLTPIGYGIFKACIVLPSSSQGHSETMLCSIGASITLSFCLFILSYIAHLRYKPIRRSSLYEDDYKNMIESAPASEETPLLDPPRQSRPRPASTRRIFPTGLMEENDIDDISKDIRREPITAVPVMPQQAPSRKESQPRRLQSDRLQVNPSTVVIPSINEIENFPLKPNYSLQNELESQNDRRRFQITLEIIETEERYVDVLLMLKKVFYQPLMAAATQSDEFDDWTKGQFNISISKPQVKPMFLELETIIRVNTALLKSLRKRFNKWGPRTRIADIFMGMRQYFKTYITYANNFNNAIQTIAKVRHQSPSFARFLEACLEVPACGRMWLDDHLVSPIQRIPRYILLLRELSRKTPPDHPDSATLIETMAKFEELAMSINESKKRAEKSLMMVTIQRMIKYCPSIVEPARQFINDFPALQMAIVPLKPSRTFKFQMDVGETSSDYDHEHTPSTQSSEIPDDVQSSQRDSLISQDSNIYVDILTPSPTNSSKNFVFPTLLESETSELKENGFVDEQPRIQLASSHDNLNNQVLLDTDTDNVVLTFDADDDDLEEDSRTQLNFVTSESTIDQENKEDEEVLEEAATDHDQESSMEQNVSASSIPLPLTPVPTCTWEPDENIVFYLFNDVVMIASLEVVQGVLGRTTEALRRLNRDEDYLTPVLVDENGNEILHKYKFQRLISIMEMEVVKYVPIGDEEPPLDHAVRVFFSKHEQGIFKSPNIQERNFFIRQFDEAKRKLMQENDELPDEVIKARRQVQIELALAGKGAQSVDSSYHESEESET